MHFLANFIILFVITLELSAILSGPDNNHRYCTWENRTEYNEVCAKQALLYSYIAFTTDLKSLYEWQCNFCKGAAPLHIISILDGSRGDYYAYIGYQISSPDVLILSFKGTNSADGWIHDSDFIFKRWPERVPGSRVHRGFLRHYSQIQQRIHDILTAWLQIYPEMKLVITGHSLGGATAMIASVDLYDLVPNPIVYTFGCPRVGNGFFAQHVKDLGLSIFRVNHDHDVVAQTPWCSFSLWQTPCPGGENPTHPPTEILYNKNMRTYIECSRENGEDPNCSSSFSKLSYSIQDHLFYFGYKLTRNFSILEPNDY